MNASNLSALTLAQLKALAVEANVTPAGDKRLKQSWINALTNSPAPELSDAEMECAACAFDNAALESAESIELSDAEMECAACAFDNAALESSEAAEEVANTESTKQSAAIVFKVIICLVVMMVTAFYYVAFAGIKIFSMLWQSIAPILIKFANGLQGADLSKPVNYFSKYA